MNTELENPPSYEEATGGGSSSSTLGTIRPVTENSPATIRPVTEENSPATSVAVESLDHTNLSNSALLSHQQNAGPPPPACEVPSASAKAKEKEEESRASMSFARQSPTRLYPVLPTACSTSSSNIQRPTLAACPVGLEPLQDLETFILREKFVSDHQGGTRRSAVVVNTSNLPLLLVQRSPRGPHRHTRRLELLDASGGGVVALLESTKRSDVLSLEVQSPPGHRIARTEVKPGSDPLQLTATLLSADEKPVIRVSLPPLGKIETEPLLQLENALEENEIKGTLQWAWGTDDDLLQAEIKLTSETDVRIKSALIALALLSMEAFSKRWSSKSGSGRGRLHLHGHRHRKHR